MTIEEAVYTSRRRVRYLERGRGINGSDWVVPAIDISDRASCSQRSERQESRWRALELGVIALIGDSQEGDTGSLMLHTPAVQVVEDSMTRRMPAIYLRLSYLCGGIDVTEESASYLGAEWIHMAEYFPAAEVDYLLGEDNPMTAQTALVQGEVYAREVVARPDARDLSRSLSRVEESVSIYAHAVSAMVTA